jgi:TRAP-type mannitol/chloroaromatic compound transport system permease small subunit
MLTAVLSIRDLYGRVLTWISLLAGTALFLLMFLVCANSLSRKLLNMPIHGTLEITEVVMPVIILLPLAYTQHRDGHIRVELLTNRLHPRAVQMLGVVTLLIAAVLFAIFAYASFNFAMRAWSVGETSWGALPLPIWPSKFVVSLGAGLLSLHFLLDGIAVALGAPPGHAHQHPEAEI